jgi:hypothetical protein
MQDYTIFTCVIQNRVYRVSAANMDEAAEDVRENYNFLEYDILDDEVDNVTVED